MSETALPKDEESVLKTPASKPEPVRTERTGSRNSGLVFLALLLAIAGIAVAGWGVWQLRMLQAGHQQQRGQVEDIAEQTLVLAQNDQQLSARIAQFPPANQLEDSRRLVAQLQGDQQRLSQRLETVLGASRRTGVWPRPSICCVWPACAFQRCRTSIVRKRWFREPTKFCVSRTIQAHSLPASNWPRALPPCAASSSRTARGCFYNWRHCVSRLCSSTSWLPNTKTKASRLWG